MTIELLPHSFFTLPDGGKLRYARVEPVGRPRGTVLIVPGRREFIEKKATELGQPLIDMGFRLVIVEPRGQGLSTRFLTADQYQRDHITDFNLHLDDLRAFFENVVRPDFAAPLILHGHSMGGHLVLRLLADPNAPPASGAFLTAPMLALTGVPAHLSAYALSWASVRLFGNATDYAPTQQDYGAEDCDFSRNPLTQDPQRFAIIENYFTKFPDMKVGGVTWGWLLAGLRSMQAAHSLHYLARIDIPVLALIGDQDRVTPANENANYLNMIPRVRTHIIPGARHDVLNETDVPRNEALQRIRGFLETVTLV
jgi:lysophospholipase